MSRTRQVSAAAYPGGCWTTASPRPGSWWPRPGCAPRHWRGLLVVLGPPPTVVIAMLTGVLGVLDAAYYPASLAPLPKVVAPAGLARANALVQGAESAGDLFAAAAAAAIVAVAGLGGGLSTVACLYLLAAIVLAAFTRRLMRTRPTTRSTGSLAATGTVGASPGLLATVHVEPAHTPTTTRWRRCVRGSVSPGASRWCAPSCWCSPR